MEGMGMSNGSGMNVCRCGHHKIIPLLIVLFGIDFLLGAFGYITMQVRNIVWPVLIIAAGFMKMTEGKCKCC